MPVISFRDCKGTTISFLCKFFLHFFYYLCEEVFTAVYPCREKAIDSQDDSAYYHPHGQQALFLGKKQPHWNMDIDLLSKIVKELILDNDEVALPGIGSFVAEIVPSSFSDKGYTINPPYRRLAFRQKTNGSENLLIDFYAKCNGLDNATASRIIGEFMEEMRHVLETKKTIILPGLGKLRATRENHFFFVADEELDIYPEGFGLEPISLKTHEETPAEVSATMAALRSILNPEESDAPEQSSSTEAGTPESATSDAELPANRENGEGADADEASGSSPEDSGIKDDIGATEEKGMSEDNAAGIAADGTEVQETSGAADDAEHHELEMVEAEVPEDADRTVSKDAEKSEIPEVPEFSEDKNLPVSGEAENADVKPEEGSERIDSPAASTEVPSEAESGSADKQDAPKVTGGDAAAATENSGKRRTWSIVKWIVLTLVFLAVMALVVFIILAHIAPDFIDSILYTPEELELLNL